MFSGLYPNKDDRLVDEEPTADIAEYEEVDEGLSGDVSKYNEEEVEYIDFLGVEDILNSPNNDVDEFYTDEKNYMFTREVMTGPFLSVFMAHGREKERQKNGKPKVLPNGVWCSRHTTRYFDDEKCHTYFGVLPCFDHKEG
jgi:hypothetical protein